VGAALGGEARRMRSRTSARDHISAEPASTSGLSAAFSTVCRGVGMLLVIFIAYGGWVVVPMAVIAALFALLRCT
jgi:hypothetical protein